MIPETKRAVERELAPAETKSDWYVSAMERLVIVVQELSHAKTLDAVTQIVRMAARELTGADGASFVLRDGDNCYYAEENAIAPLWKGKRFPMINCVSGWVMKNSEPAVIEDIYNDPRVPYDAYRPTFVKSMAMVPIRLGNPIGAIGNYWATVRQPTQEEISILQALANVTSVALENAGLYTQLQEKVKALEESNYELARFAWSASHDLKSPLRAIHNLSSWIEEDAGNKLQGESLEYLATMRRRVKRMEKLLDDILDFSTVEKKLKADDGSGAISGAALIAECESLVDLPAGFALNVSDAMSGVRVRRMPLLRIFCNLIDNAIKHHDKKHGVIDIGVSEDDNYHIFTVADDGPGIPAEYRKKIFEMFQTLKPRDVTEGSGMGLAIVKKMLAVYGGTISVEDSASGGTVFRFTWPKSMDGERRAS